MNLFALIFLASVVVSLQFNQLPVFWLMLVISVMLLITLVLRQRRAQMLCIAALSGVILVQVTLYSQLSRQLGPDHQGMRVMLVGRVVDIPRIDERRARFRFQVESFESKQAPANIERVSLSWYGSANLNIKPGQRWRLTVKLRSPGDQRNPGGFDYAGWLFRQRIHAIGHVIATADNQLLSTSASIAGTRNALALRLASDANQATHVGLMQALLVGIRTNVSKATWDLLRATGTSHLLAISGLHIGMLAAWGFTLGSLLWWFTLVACGRWQNRSEIRTQLPFNRLDFAACLSLFAALVYASLAGFTVPTQRALIMLSVVLLVKFLRRHSDPYTPIALALILILVHDPLAPLSAGFWLSFSAVMILLGIGSRYSKSGSLWKRAVLTHLCMGLLMFPLTALFFGQGSLIAPLANLLAIPYVSFLVVPPLMLWLIIAPYSSFVAQHLLGWTQLTLASLLDLLYWLQEWIPAEVSLGSIRPIDFGTLLCAALLVVLPKIRYQRWLILPFVLPFCWNQAVPVATDQLSVTVLDVGDSVAVVVRNPDHTLLYGGGGRFRGGRSKAQSVLIPYFRATGIRRLDKWLLPETEADPAQLKAEMDASLKIASTLMVGKSMVSGNITSGNIESCQSGIQWEAGGTEFVIYQLTSQMKPKALICVLSIRHGTNHIILSAGLSLTELDNLATDLQQLQAQRSSLTGQRPTLVVVQTPPKASTMRPEHLVFSSGLNEQDEFAHEAVQMRYKIRGVTTYRTDQSGAIEFSFSPNGLNGSPRSYRRLRQRAWHQPAPRTAQ